jgi:hypothetical protein
MADLEYSIDLLDGFGGRLVTLGKSMKDDKALDDLGRDELGHQRLVDAVQDFNDHWDDNRELVGNKVENLGKMASQSAEAFTEADKKLADKVADIIEENE